MEQKTSNKGESTRFKKGCPPGPGRPKGSKSLTTDLRTMMFEALDRAGGVAYLAKQARSHPGAFLAALARMLPQTMKVDADYRVLLPDLPLATAGLEARRQLLVSRLAAAERPSPPDDANN
jgi:hypothetical protein